MLKHMSKLFAIAAVTAAVSVSAGAQTVLKSIALPTVNSGGIVANPITNKIYAVSSSGSAAVNDTVSVIDGTTDTIAANISVPSGAAYPAVDILTNRIYVASCNSFLNPAPCFVTVIDGKTNTVTTTIPVVTILNGLLAGIAVDPITSTVYVSDNTDRDIVVIDANKNTVTGTISLGDNTPWGLAVNPFNNKLYVTLGTDAIDIINPKTQEIAEVSTGAGSVGFNVAVDWLTGRVFVTNTQFDTPSTTAILNQRGVLLAEVQVGQAAYGVDIDPVTNLAFVAAINDNNTSVVDVKTKTLKATIDNTFATFLSVNATTQKVYAIGSGMVTVSPE